MIRTVTALFDSNDEAEGALTQLSRAVPIMKAGIVTAAPGGKPDFGAIYLSRTQREACETELASGGSLLIAQVEGDRNAEQAVDLLDRLAQGSAPAPAAAPEPIQTSAAPPAAPAASVARTPIAAERVEGVPVSTMSRRAAPEPAPVPATATAASTAIAAASTAAAVDLTADPPPEREPAATAKEEIVPVVEEELRVGKRSVMRGGARVHSYMEEVPVYEEIELIEERTHVEHRPVNRRLTEEEIVASGLLQDRVVEVTQMREEAVLTKEAFVREELVVKKTTEKRVEQIRETVRRTAVEVERLEPELASDRSEARRS